MKAGIKRAHEDEHDLDENDIVDDRSQQDQVKPKRATPITYDDFIVACETGNLEEVEEGIETLTDDIIASNYNYALSVAGENGHLAVVNRLLEIDLIRRIVATDNNRVLLTAVLYGHLSVVNRLLEIDEVRKHATARNNCALLWAARNGDIPVVKRLLQIPAVREAAVSEINDTQNHSNQNGFMYNTLNSILTPLVGMARKLVFGDPQIDPIQTVLKRLAEQYPDLKISIDKENRKNEARALYFAYRASKSKPACSQSMLKKYGQRDTVVKIMQMVLNSPPPAQQLDEPLTKKLR